MADCEGLCGSECYTTPGGALACPPECVDDDDCPTDRLCTYSRLTADLRRVRRCLGSECLGPDDLASCGPGRACTYLGRLAGGVFRCVDAGHRDSGEVCAFDDYAPVGLCKAGLACVNGVCVPGECRTSESCPRGAKCFSLAGGGVDKACMPTCSADTDCPAERPGCYVLPGAALGSCHDVTNAACIRDGCPPGRTCYLHNDMPADLVATCVQTCAGFRDDACGAASACVRSEYPPSSARLFRCAQTCASDEDCVPGWECADGICSYDARAGFDRYFQRY